MSRGAFATPVSQIGFPICFETTSRGGFATPASQIGFPACLENISRERFATPVDQNSVPRDSNTLLHRHGFGFRVMIYMITMSQSLSLSGREAAPTRGQTSLTI
eukprot:583487-Karenia_brevis.AAC.1